MVPPAIKILSKSKQPQVPRTTVWCPIRTFFRAAILMLFVGSLCASAVLLAGNTMEAGDGPPPSSRELPTVIYVATDGQDRWSGALASPNADRTDGPLASIQAARDLVRRLKPRAGARVLVRGGRYVLDEPIRFSSIDSGGSDSRRSYEAYPGERVVLVGTRKLSGRWRMVRPQVYVSDVGTQLASNASFRTLFVDGKRAVGARYPNEGFIRAIGGEGKSVVKLPEALARGSWALDPSARLNIVADLGWYNEIVRISRVSEAGDQIELEGRELQGKILAGNRFFVEGVLDELDAVGEWYLDRLGGKLYYFSEADPARSSFEAAVIDRLIEVRGTIADPVAYLDFCGLDFFGSDHSLDHVAVRTSQDAAIHLINAHKVTISECRFVSIGGYAVWLHLDARENVIRRNEVVDSGAGGILLTGARFSYLSEADIYDASPAVQRVAPLGNVIAENHIHHGGKVRDYCSGVHLDSRHLDLSRAMGNYIGFNHIHDMPRNGIFIFRNQGGNVIEGNVIHDVLQRTNDGGAIHLASMNPLCSPTHIVDNRIYRVGYQEGKQNKVSLAFGIYPDWFTSNMVIRGNIISDTRDGGIRLLGGSDVLIEDNVVGDDPTASIVFGRWTTGAVSGMVLRGNTVVNGDGDWIRYFTGGSGADRERVAMVPKDFWTAEKNSYWARGSGSGIVISRSARNTLQPGDWRLSLGELQERGSEAGSLSHFYEARSPIDLSRDPESFGAGSGTMARIRNPRSTVAARQWLERLRGVAKWVSFDDGERVTASPDWAPEPTKIAAFLAFADLKQATSRSGGGSISFSVHLEPGSYAVFVRWYGDPEERSPWLEIDLMSPGSLVHRLRVDHRQEAHKWIRVGTICVSAAGEARVTAFNDGRGVTALNAVAWLRESSGPDS